MTGRSRRSLLWRLGVALMVVQAVVAIGLGLYARGKIRSFHEAQTLGELRRVMPLAVESLRELPGDDDRLQREVERLAALTDLRLTVIDADGVVQADSDYDRAHMENHRNRREIDAAFRLGSGSDSRLSGTLGIAMMYAATRQAGPDGSTRVVRASIPLTAANRELARLQRLIGAAALVSLVVTLTVIYFVSRRFAATVARLADAASRFSGGDLRHRIDPPAGAELASLAEALNGMAVQLDGQIRQLQGQRNEQRAILQSMSDGMLALDLDHRVLNVNRSGATMLGIDAEASRGRLLEEVVREPDLNRFVDVALESEPRRTDELTLAAGGRRLEVASETLRDAADRQVGIILRITDVTELRRLESIRSDFAANVSHELRTPITSIRGYLETMLDVGYDDPEQTDAFLEVIRRNAVRLEAIIEDLLALAHLEQSGARANLETTRFDAAEALRGVVGHVLESAEERDMSIELNVEPDLALFGAPRLIEQAVTNLLTNAIAYGPEGSTIRVAARAVEGDVEISVADEGPGIAAEHLPRLFERFYRVDQARSRSMGGTGLGLAIVKHIALVHRGRAEVESEPGRGSVFRIRVPRNGSTGAEVN